MSEIEEAIALLRSNGYDVTKRKPYERLKPCVCGHNRRNYAWLIGSGGSVYECKKCGFRGGVGSSEKDARRKWNEAVERHKERARSES